MRYLLFAFIFVFIFTCCKERSKKNMYIDKVVVDTLGDGIGISFRIRVDNNSNSVINLYTGTGTTKKDTNNGFFVYCKKIKTYFALIAPYKNAQTVIPPNITGYKIFATIGFRPFSMLDSSEIFKVINNYYTANNRSENINKFLNDIEITYRVKNVEVLKIPIKNMIIYYYTHNLNELQQTLQD